MQEGLLEYDTSVGLWLLKLPDGSTLRGATQEEVLRKVREYEDEKVNSFD